MTATALTNVSASAEDYLRFLKQKNAVRVIRENGKVRQFPGGHDEKYWAENGSGTKKFKLRLKNALPNYAEVGFDSPTSY
jgi:hypothetical protein